MNWKVCALLFCVLNVDVNVNHIMQWQLKFMLEQLPELDALELANWLWRVPLFLHQNITTNMHVGNWSKTPRNATNSGIPILKLILTFYRPTKKKLVRRVSLKPWLTTGLTTPAPTSSSAISSTATAPGISSMLSPMPSGKCFRVLFDPPPLIITQATLQGTQGGA
jgi:hypothetical protein